MGLGCDDRGAVILAMSTCMGLYGCQIARAHHKAPYNLLFGPQKSIEWSDSLTAWITMYHLFLKKNIELERAIDAMNIAAGVEPMTFAVISGEAMEDRLSKNC